MLCLQLFVRSLLVHQTLPCEPCARLLSHSIFRASGVHPSATISASVLAIPPFSTPMSLLSRSLKSPNCHKYR
ncbi:hypothetical protein L2E82_15463 [Cichorium intybus]|uniref:Uncharacterized protein n=1 Tax=Cichorium intybus TaxID=13427 RepID=A0ACB9F395_CICIN|nr:hypothetical protein L2E82_15463 [Cichorium intybus]